MQAVLIKLNSTPHVGALNSPLTIRGLNFGSSKSTLPPNYLNWDWIMERNICWAKSKTNDLFTHIILIVFTFFAALLKKFPFTPYICMHKSPYLHQMFFTGLCSWKSTKFSECNINWCTGLRDWLRHWVTSWWILE